MSDAFVPEADRLDQERQVEDRAVEQDDERRPVGPSPARTFEASEADLLDQSVEVGEDEDFR